MSKRWLKVACIPNYPLHLCIWQPVFRKPVKSFVGSTEVSAMTAIEKTIWMFSVHSRHFLADFFSIFRHCLARFVQESYKKCLDLQESCKKRLNLQEMSDLSETDRFV